MPLRIADLTPATTITESSDIVELSQPSQADPTSRKATLAQILAGVRGTVSGKLDKSANLSDLADASTARGNLGLGSAAVHAATEFDPAGAAASESERAVAAELSLGGRLSTLEYFASLAGTTGAVPSLGVYQVVDMPVENGVWDVAGVLRADLATGSSTEYTTPFEFSGGISLSADSVGAADYVARHREVDFRAGGYMEQARTIPLSRQILTVTAGHIYAVVNLVTNPIGDTVFRATLVGRRIL